MRGSVIVQAAKRRSGHLYVDTADYRVAVTGTIFGVSAGVKGSRVSVIQGEVHVTQDSSEKILHPGEQAVSSPDLEPESVKDDISWSRNRERYYSLLAALRVRHRQPATAGSALLQQDSGPAARIHGVLCQHSESLAVSGRTRNRCSSRNIRVSGTGQSGVRYIASIGGDGQAARGQRDIWAMRSSWRLPPVPMASRRPRCCTPR